MLTWIVIIVLVLLLIGAFPRWSYSRRWGWRPSGILGILIVLVILAWLLGWL